MDPRSRDQAPRVAFIGGGNMSRAMVGGLLGRGWPATSVHVADPDPAQREAMARACPGVRVHASNPDAAAQAGIWVLAVKPQQMREVALGLAALAAASRPLVVSIAAGIRTGDLRAWLGPDAALVRAMPNSPALLGAGISALCAVAAVDAAGRELATRLLGAVGEVVWLDDESLMDAVTAVSGSGPAYVFLLAEMLEATAITEGIDPATARRLAGGTLAGAARMLREAGEEPAVLRERVTSPGGTTAAALAVLEAASIRATFARAIAAGRERSQQLAAQFGDEAEG